jgi:murein DD-endopeptidase MepM/ murein hydrolase activator NlpD
VVKTGNDPVYGNYILIAHEEDWVSLYGHLSAFLTSANSYVTRSSPIAKVGSTGQSTGPHLHFELRKNGTALDPGKMLYRN